MKRTDMVSSYIFGSVILAVAGLLYKTGIERVPERYGFWLFSVLVLYQALRAYNSKECPYCYAPLLVEEGYCPQCKRPIEINRGRSNAVTLDRRASSAPHKSNPVLASDLGRAAVVMSALATANRFLVRIFLSFGIVAIFVFTVSLLIAKKHSNNEGISKKVMEAIKKGDLSEVKVNAPKLSTLEYNAGNSPLNLAVAEGRKEIMSYLLMRGADPNWRVMVGELSSFPLGEAARRGDNEMISVLLEHHANLGIRDKNGMTALLIAVENNHLEAVKILVSHGAKINAQDALGRTALHIAVRKDLKEIGLLLKQKKASTDIPDKMGDTALELAHYFERSWLLDVTNDMADD